MNNPITRIMLDALLVVFIALGALNSYQIRQSQDDLKAEITVRSDAAYANCQAANDSRQVVVNILRAAENATKQQPPSDERAKAIRFYDDQIAQIKFSECAAFKR